VELAVLHGLVAVRHLPRTGRALADDLDHRLDVEPGLFGEVEAFGEALDEAGDADLVYHLGKLAGARGAEAAADAGIGRDHRLGAGIVRFRAAAHDREDAVLRPRLAAGDGRIDEADRGGRRRRGEFAGDRGRDRGVIDEDRARGHAPEGAFGAGAYGAQVIVIADAG